MEQLLRNFRKWHGFACSSLALAAAAQSLPPLLHTQLLIHPKLSAILKRLKYLEHEDMVAKKDLKYHVARALAAEGWGMAT